MELKFTDEQYEAVRDRVWAQVAQVRRVSMPSKKECGRAYVHASLPLLAPVLLGPATDQELVEFAAAWVSTNSRRAALNAFVDARLAKYLPKPVDPAVEAVKKMLIDRLKLSITDSATEEIVAAVRAADRQAK